MDLLELSVRVLVGGGLFGGLALLVRALGGLRSVATVSAERVAVLQERTIERQQRENDELAEDLATCRRARDHAWMLVRYYRAAHGDPTDPRMRRLVIEEENGRAPF